jgi:hypothetical protein
MHLLNDSTKITKNFKGQISFLEGMGNAVVRQVGEGNVAEVIASHESVEHSCAKDGHGGNVHCNIWEISRFQSAMERLARSLAPERLAVEAFHLYEEFRPEVPPGVKGWGVKGTLDIGRILALAR